MKFLLRLLIFASIFLVIFSKPNIGLSQEKSATITIGTFPNGAAIFIDNKFIGVSPIKGRSISIGMHHIRAELDTLQKAVDLEIVPGENKFDLKLEPIKLELDTTDQEEENKTPSTPPIYKKPIFWGGVAVIVATVSYLLFKPNGKGSKSLPLPPDPPPGK